MDKKVYNENKSEVEITHSSDNIGNNSFLGGISKPPLTTPNITLGNDIATTDLITKHFDYWNIHVTYLRTENKSFDDFDSNFITLLKELCHTLRLKFRYERGRGGEGFRSSIILNEGLHILYNSTFNSDPSIDVVRINIKGSEYALFLKRGGNPRDLFNFKHKWNGYDKRIDLTINLFYPLFSIQDIEDKLNRGEVDTKAKTWYSMPLKEVTTSNIVGKSLYIGRGNSNSKRYLNIYDKVLEMLAKKKICDKDFWIRFELRLSDEWAENFVENYFKTDSNYEREKIFIGAFNDFFRPIDYYDEDLVKSGHKSRIPTWSKWLDMIHYSEKYKLSSLKDGQSYVNQSSMNVKKDWFNRSCSKTLAMMYLCERYSGNGVVSFLKNLKEIIYTGLSNITNVDLAVLNNFLNNSELSIESVIEEIKNLNDEFSRLISVEKISFLEDVFGSNLEI